MCRFFFYSSVAGVFIELKTVLFLEQQISLSFLHVSYYFLLLFFHHYVLCSICFIHLCMILDLEEVINVVLSLSLSFYVVLTAETAVPVRAGSLGHQKALSGAPFHFQPYCTKCYCIKWFRSLIGLRQHPPELVVTHRSILSQWMLKLLPLICNSVKLSFFPCSSASFCHMFSLIQAVGQHF